MTKGQSRFASAIMGGELTTVQVDEDGQEKISYFSDDFSLMFFLQEFIHNRNDYIPFHWHEQLQLLWVYEGELEYNINGETIRIDKNTLLFINKYQLHSSKTIENDAKTLCINFDIDFFHPTVLMHFISPMLEVSVLDYYVIKPIDDLEAKLKDLVSRIDGSESIFSVITLVTQAFDYMLEHINISKLPKETNGEIEIFNKMLTFVQENYMKKIKVEDIANEGLINKNLCTELFQKYAKISPMKYVNRYRLYVGRQFILQTDKTIAEVSEEVGFNQYSYFIEQFRLHYALPPLQYRKEFSK